MPARADTLMSDQGGRRREGGREGRAGREGGREGRSGCASIFDDIYLLTFSSCRRRAGRYGCVSTSHFLVCLDVYTCVCVCVTPKKGVL